MRTRNGQLVMAWLSTFLKSGRCLSSLPLVLGCLLGLTPILPAAEAPTPVYIQADYLERLPAVHLLRFQGAVDIRHGDSHVVADTVEVNTETGEGIAEGHVLFEDPQQRIAAERAEFNLFTRLGTLYQATGSVQGKSPLHPRGHAPKPLTFYLTAGRVIRETEERSRISRGSLTTCAGPSPAWRFEARRATIETEGYAHLQHASFWIKNIPVFYSPYFLYPTKTERATGFLPPIFGSSDQHGLFLNNRFFWAINESSDSTIGLDFLSQRGVRPSLEYRYALSPTDHGQFSGIHIADKLTEHQFWKVTGTSQHRLPGDVYGILTLDLISRENYDRTFEGENTHLRTRREATSFLSLTRNWDTSALALRVQQQEDVELRADERLTRYPEMEFSILPTRLPWGPLAFDLDANAALFRFERAATRGRDVDARRLALRPQVAWTHVYGPWFAVTPFLAFQETLLDLGGESPGAQGVPVIGAEVSGPKLFKVYGGEAIRYKHLFEPSLTYYWIPSFTEKTRRQPFDFRDDVFPRNDLLFNFTNRFFMRTQAAEDSLEIRELGLLRISQGIDLRGQKGREFVEIAPGPFFADLSVEARVQLTSNLSLSADAAYDYTEGQFDVANAGMALQPVRFLSLSVDRRFRRAPDIDFILGGVGLNLPKGWSLSYSTGYNARDKAFAGNNVGVLYQAGCWNLRLGMSQLPDETRFVVQIGLDAFQGPALRF